MTLGLATVLSPRLVCRLPREDVEVRRWGTGRRPDPHRYGDRSSSAARAARSVSRAGTPLRPAGRASRSGDAAHALCLSAYRTGGQPRRNPPLHRHDAAAQAGRLFPPGLAARASSPCSVGTPSPPEHCCLGAAPATGESALSVSYAPAAPLGLQRTRAGRVPLQVRRAPALAPTAAARRTASNAA